jgi:CRP-like cAMP-binding protein
MNDQRCFILGSVLGQDLSSEECSLFKEMGSARDLADGQVLIEEGKTDNCLHIVIDGHLAVGRQSAGGEWINLHILQKGELAGEMGFIDGQGHSASLRAVGPTRVFSLERNTFESLLETNPHMVYRVMRAIVRGVHNTMRRMNMQQLELTNYITHQHGRY